MPPTLAGARYIVLRNLDLPRKRRNDALVCLILAAARGSLGVRYRVGRGMLVVLAHQRIDGIRLHSDERTNTLA